MTIAEILAIYVVGTAAGATLFHIYIKERIVKATLDTMIEADYIRTSLDESGDIMLHRWYEVDDLIEEEHEEKDDT